MIREQFFAKNNILFLQKPPPEVFNFYLIIAYLHNTTILRVKQLI